MSLSAGTELGAGPGERSRTREASGRRWRLAGVAGVAFRVLRNSQKASWVSKTHEASEKAQKEIMSRDSVGGGGGRGKVPQTELYALAALQNFGLAVSVPTESPCPLLRVLMSLMSCEGRK